MFHFTKKSRILGYGDGRTVIVGETLKAPEGKGIILCKYGLHASPRIIDALEYAPGCTLWEVTLGGTIINDIDKSVATERTANVCYGDIIEDVVDFAAWCAEEASHHAARAASDARSAWAASAASAARAASAASDAEKASQESWWMERLACRYIAACRGEG